MIEPDRDLFGEPLASEPKPLTLGPYPYKPGTGPAGETCKSCANAYATGGRGRHYWKCLLVKRSASVATDIRLKSPACRAWKAPT